MGAVTMPPRWNRGRRWLLGVTAVGAVLLILLSPWYHGSPFALAVLLWLVGFFQLMGAGTVMAFSADLTPVHLVSILAGMAIAMFPWLGLHALVSTTSRGQRVLLGAPIAGLALIVGLGLPALVEMRAIGRPFGPWYLVGMVSVVGLGLSFVGSGVIVLRSLPRARLRALGHTLVGSGLCISVLIALPLGVIGLALSYVLLALLLMGANPNSAAHRP
jgi:hypothetical protein